MLYFSDLNYKVILCEIYKDIFIKDNVYTYLFLTDLLTETTMC